MKYKGEQTTVEIGDRVIIRESVTINRGTAALGKTTIGNDVLLMAYVHVAHDCFVGDHAILANLVTLGGHVEIGVWASLGGGVLIHQFCRVGEHAFVGGGYRIVQDVPPYILAAGEPLRFGGINRIGLRRRGFPPGTRDLIKKAYKEYFLNKASRSEALKKIKNDLEKTPEITRIIHFIESSERGII